MAKIALGARPKNFKTIVKVQMLDGTEGEIEMVFIYRTRKEFGNMIDEMVSDAKALEEMTAEIESENPEQTEFSLVEAMKKSQDANIDYVMKIAEGWNLDIDFSRESMAELFNELPMALSAIMNAYRNAVTDGRVGN